MRIVDGMSRLSRNRYQLDFPALMSQCEANYARMMQLMRVLGDRDQVTLDVSADGCRRRVWVRLLEKARYTTILQLEQDAVHPLMPAPALTVRLYHDARLAEVTEARPWRKVAARNGYPNAAMHAPDEKHQWNLFLGEWLRHVHAHGRSLYSAS